MDIESHWSTFAESQPAGAAPGRPYEVDRFGDTPELMDELGALVVSGRKTATCSSVWEWEAQERRIPAVGDRTIVVDSRNLPLCIIETTDVGVRAFADVDAAFAWDEGEDDRTLASWRREHIRYFRRILPPIGRQFSESMLVVCERFRLVYVWDHGADPEAPGPTLAGGVPVVNEGTA